VILGNRGDQHDALPPASLAKPDERNVLSCCSRGAGRGALGLTGAGRARAPGTPGPARDADLRTWRGGVGALAQPPHAHAKLSAFSWLGTPRDARSVRTVVTELLELLGPQRCMVSSNFPVERLAGRFAAL
jgi:hypothetical protein